METIEVMQADLQRTGKTVGELRTEIKALRAALDETAAGSDDNAKALKDFNEAQAQLKIATRNLNSELVDQKGSFNDLSKQLALLKEAWKATGDEAERNRLGKQINEIKGQLNGMNESIGNYQHNVGNYKASILSAFHEMGGAVGTATQAVGGMTAGLQALSATPAVAIIGTLAMVINKVVGNLDSAEGTIHRVTEALSLFAGAGDVVTKAMQWLGNAVAGALEWLGRLAEKWGLVSETMLAHQELTEAQNELIKRQREAIYLNADAEREISGLRLKVAQKDKYTQQERIAFLDQAIAKEQEMADRQADLARQEYENIKTRNSFTESSTAELNEEAQAYARMQQALTNAQNKQREMASQRAEIINQMRGNGAAAAKVAEEAEAEWVQPVVEAMGMQEQALSEHLGKSAELNKTFMDEELKYVMDINATRLEVERERQELEQQEEEAAQKRKLAVMRSTLASASTILDALADMGEQNGKQSEKELRKNKALRIASATIEMLNGAVSAYSAAQSLGVPLGPILGAANAAAVIAAGTANINKIKSTEPGGSAVSAASSFSRGAAVNAPAVVNTVPLTRSLTGVAEEERLNASQRVVLVWSDVEEASRKVALTHAEASF